MTDTALVLGTFDGLHTAHKKVLSAANGAKKRVAVIFSLPPSMVISGRTELLQTVEEKIEMFKSFGFTVETLDFNKVRSLTAEEFLQSLLEKYNPKTICCGYNYHFGFGGKGNTELLSGFCKENGITLSVTPAVEMLGDRVSSSRIRALIRNGDVETANKLLSRPFAIKGTVTHGDSRGRTLGYPTVNFPYPADICELKHGVYATRVNINGAEYSAVTYVGKRPTYKLENTILETNIIGFEGDLYEKELTVHFLQYIRGEKTFSSTEELKNQINADIISAQNK